MPAKIKAMPAAFGKPIDSLNIHLASTIVQMKVSALAGRTTV